MTDQETWNSFVATAPGGSFLQSWEWGEMQAQLGVPYWRLVLPLPEGEPEGVGATLAGAALVVKRQLPWGKSWLYIPKGPLWENSKFKIQNSKLFQQIIELGHAEKAVFIRIEPYSIPPDEWRKAVNDVQPRNTLMLDLTKTEEELLAEMHSKTRYNIRLAQKRGVRVRFSTDAADVDHFLRLSSDVHERSAFHYHPDNYYRTMLKVLGSPTLLPLRGAASAEIAVAEHEGEVLAVHLLMYFGGTATYVHGASSSVKRDLMAPHLLQWESIKRAKERGYTAYDFFGVKPSEADASHSWTGITRFKEGFGGQRVSYAGAYDYVLDPLWYWTYSTSRRARSLWR
jgi:peptidoglycan pentaglycine glycine transferase (the first glycine)